jgi:elongation factor 1-gamma
LTVADIVVACALVLPFQTALDAGFRKAMPNVSNWMDRVIKLPEVVARLGNVKFAAKVIKAQVVAKKEEVKVAAKKDKAEGHDDDEEKPAKKEVDPLDVLPPSKFDLYNFKTFFVNSKDRRGEGMKAFFEQYDKEGYCIYFVNYTMYEGEGVVTYQTANLLNGFL